MLGYRLFLSRKINRKLKCVNKKVKFSKRAPNKKTPVEFPKKVALMWHKILKPVLNPVKFRAKVQDWDQI